MVDEDTREEWAKYATPNDEWQSAHRKNSIIPITPEDKDKIEKIMDVIPISKFERTNRDLSDFRDILLEVRNGNEETAKAIEKINEIISDIGLADDSSSNEPDVEAECESIQEKLNEISR